MKLVVRIKYVVQNRNNNFNEEEYRNKEQLCFTI